MSRKLIGISLIYFSVSLVGCASQPASTLSDNNNDESCLTQAQSDETSTEQNQGAGCATALNPVNNSIEKPSDATKVENHGEATELANIDLQAEKPESVSSTTQENEQSSTLSDEALAAQKEEQRLKVLFVDVNSVMENVGHTMDWTANWIDGYFTNNEKGKDKAKAWGHIIMGWEPRDGEWGNFPIKFKVQAKLPNLKNKVELILSDNEQDDFKNLPYESVRPDAYKSSQRSLGAAVRFLHASTENIRTSSRLGWGDNQVYARTQLTYRQKYFKDKVTLSLQPAIEYYVSDGWGGRFLVDTGFELSPNHELRYNYSIRDLESYEQPEWRTGIYSISAVSEKSAVIVGASAVGVVEPEHNPEFYKFSIRYRRKAIRSWIFVEFEPFVEFSRERLLDDMNEFVDYAPFVRDIGVTLRLEAHYGFL